MLSQGQSERYLPAAATVAHELVIGAAAVSVRVRLQEYGLGAHFKRPFLYAGNRRFQIERLYPAVQGSHPGPVVIARGIPLGAQPARFGLNLFGLFDPRVCHPVRGILEWILLEIERFTRAFEVIESAFLHCLPNLSLGNKMPFVHRMSLKDKAARAGAICSTRSRQNRH
jgi:hypothetical protein